MTLWGNGTKIKPRVSSKYGPRKGGAFSFHYGTDFTGYTDLHAILGGVVTQVGRMNAQAGNVIVIDTKLPSGQTVTVVRMHCASWTVKRGDHVTEGQVIGRMGDTGNATGLCDHVEIRFWSGGKLTRVDPEVWIAQQIEHSMPAPAGGGSHSLARPGKEEEDEMIVNIQGKTGVRLGGAYYIEGGAATYLGGNVAGAPTLDFEQGTRLAKRVSGI